MTINIAICIITFNRIYSLKRILNNLNSGVYDNNNVDLIISIDYSGKDDIKNVAEEYIWSHGKKRVLAHDSNLGLRNHIIKCGDLTKEYDALIVLEDDIYVAPSFYLYAKATVVKYYNDESIAGISLYNFNSNYHNWLPFTPIQSDSDVYLMQNAQSWGQIWMKKQWQKFKEWYNNNNDDFPDMPHLPTSICSWKKSWLKYHTRYCIENNKFFVYPYVSLSTCFGDEGEHTSQSNILTQVPLLNGIKREYKLNPTVKYDAFFENMDIPFVLGINANEICVDLYGEKQNKMDCRYWLSLTSNKFKIVKSFALQLKPMDQNIFSSLGGKEIKLYDTSVKSLHKGKDTETTFYRYIYNNCGKTRQDIKILVKEILYRILK